MVSCKRIPSNCIHFRLKFPACLLGACFFFSRFSRPRGWRWSACIRSRGLHRCLGWVHPNSFSLKKIYRKFHVSFTLSTNSTDSTIHLKQASLLYYELDRAWHVCVRYLKWIYPHRSQAWWNRNKGPADATYPHAPAPFLLTEFLPTFQQARLQLAIKVLQHNQRSNWERTNVTLV